MFEKIVDICKEFLEKHFLPSLFSVVLLVITYFLTPLDSSFLVKLGKNLYLFFLFCFFLLVIELVIILSKKINDVIYVAKQKKKHNRKIEQENTNYLYDLLESLEPEEFDIVDYLVENKNNYITTYQDYIINHYRMEMLFDSKKYRVKEESISSIDLHDLTKEIVFNKDDYVTQFRLKEDIYDCLKFIKKKKGKISRF